MGLGLLGEEEGCYVMLCHVMLCYAMLCYVMLCYVMLCYAWRGGGMPCGQWPVRDHRI